MASINIFALPNGVGISRDIELIRGILQGDGHTVVVNNMYRYQRRQTFDLSIHLERFKPELFNDAKKNVMIPNQEWFEPSWVQYLPAFDCIFTKSKLADALFKKLNCRTHFISFTSEDRLLPDVQKDEQHWFHLAGKSVQKQTEMVMRVWGKNPGFPFLTVLQDAKFYKPRMVLRNVNFMYCRLSDPILRVMQNTFGVHVCPSEAEGFGHYIMEAMSCGGVVLTTNSPPMNELVTPERGVLCEPARVEQLRLSCRALVSEETLTRAVVQAMVLDDEKRTEIRQRGRAFFLENDAFFRTVLPEAVAAVLSQ
jgi:hypothetical protein